MASEKYSIGQRVFHANNVGTIRFIGELQQVKGKY